MKFEPNTFFINIIDFFSVMLPGAVFTALISREATGILFESGLPQYPQEAKWVVFVFSSYLLGHFIFLIGSKIDTIYQRIRGTTKDDTKSVSRLNKFLAVRVFPKDPDLALDAASSIKAKYMPNDNDNQVINAFQWAKARLTIQCPIALQEVQRFEANSKFFRSLVVVLLISAVWLSGKALWINPTWPFVWHSWQWSHGNWPVVAICLFLGYFSFLRYAGQRFKATQQAYWYVITLENLPKQSGNNKSS